MDCGGRRHSIDHHHARLHLPWRVFARHARSAIATHRMSESIADIRDLSIRFDTQQGPVYPLRNVNVDVPRGQIVGIVGESGSGKSTLALALMRLLPGNAVITSGEVDLLGKDLLTLPAEEMRGL